MNFGFTIDGKEFVALGWQSESQLWIAQVISSPSTYLKDPEIMYFRDFIKQLSDGTLRISETLPVLT